MSIDILHESETRVVRQTNPESLLSNEQTMIFHIFTIISDDAIGYFTIREKLQYFMTILIGFQKYI